MGLVVERMTPQPIASGPIPSVNASSAGTEPSKGAAPDA
jgi:hypothetical protein